MSPENLWGKLPEASAVKPPITILLEQATALKDATNGVLVGEVRSRTRYHTFTVTLSIIAPALNNYRYEVLEIEHPVDFYPLAFTASTIIPPMRAQNEEEFLLVLRSILSSEKVHSVTAALIAQSKASGNTFLDEQ